MPYITKERRFIINKLINFDNLDYLSAGDLNYIITKLLHCQLKNVNYSKINELIGVLECAKLELYRVQAAPYEDEKRKQNGDI